MKKVSKEFIQDYCEVMIKVHTLPEHKIIAGSTFLKANFAKVKRDAQILNFFIDMLNIYSAHSPNYEKHKADVEFLIDLAKQYISKCDLFI